MYSVCIDNLVFRWHHNLTCTILVVSAVFIGVSQWLGDPIRCFSDGSLQVDVVCKTQPPFDGTISSSGVEFGSYFINPLTHPWIILLMQAFYFYMPYFVWKRLDHGQFQWMISDLNRPDVIKSRKTYCKKVLVNYLATDLQKQNRYALKLFLCEVSNLINVIWLTFFFNHYIGYYFGTTRSDSFLSKAWDNKEFRIPVSKTVPFPITSCNDFPFDNVKGFSALGVFCYFPALLASEKICEYIWYWFFCLTVLTAVSVACCLVDLLDGSVHLTVMQTRSSLVPPKVKYNQKKLPFATIFLLNKIRKNVRQEIFKDIVYDLCMKLHVPENTVFII